MPADFDIAVVGSGFAGSLLAMIARRLGRSVILIERGQHPRFAIGESSTPLANLLLEELAQRHELPEVAALCKWGTWRKSHPEVASGLKRGFSFYHHSWGQEWKPEPARGNELLVAASPHDEIADTHWYRPDFDHFLVQQARRQGAEFIDQTKLTGAEFSADDVRLTGERDGEPFTLRCRFVVDATGPRGFLSRSLNLPDQPFGSMPPTQALYSHFRGVKRWDAVCPPDETPPFPVDDAALHHVFEGGWIWVLRFNNGITSAGVAATADVAGRFRFDAGAAAWQRLLEFLPSIREQFRDAVESVPFVHAPNLSFRSQRAAGSRWALLPSAAGFVDPLLSTGFPLTLLGVERLARILETAWQSPDMAAQLRRYEERTLGELDVTASLVGALYANMDHFRAFSSLTLLYFSAAMYAETKRRLGQSEVVDSFLLSQHPRFGPALHSILGQAKARNISNGANDLLAAITRAIEPINLARLGDPSLRNWYPCRAEDLLNSAPKLGVGLAAVEGLLNRCGFNTTNSREQMSPPARIHAR